MAVRTAEEAKLKDTFEQLAARLRQAEFQPRLVRKLAYWVQKSDRRLPLAFLDQTVGEIVQASYGSLVASAGIGPKKLQCLLKLLRRVLVHEAPPSAGLAEPTTAKVTKANGHPVAFDSEHVSEVEWERWRQTVLLFGFEQEKLGRMAPSLARLPFLIWHTPLAFYLDHSLEQLRELKTYGRKRVSVVMEVFHAIHNLFQNGVPSPYFAVRLTPRFILPIEAWTAAVLKEERLPLAAEVYQEVVEPLLAQFLEDAGENVEQLARARLDVGSDAIPMRQQAIDLGVTRSRIYQMLEECGHVLEVRWPEGRCVLRQLQEHLVRHDADHVAAKVLGRLLDLSYPAKLDPVSKHLVAASS